MQGYACNANRRRLLKMSTTIGNYSLSKDRSTVYFNDVIIYKSGIMRLGPDLYTEDGKVCFYDVNTRSIYHAKEKLSILRSAMIIIYQHPIGKLMCFTTIIICQKRTKKFELL